MIGDREPFAIEEKWCQPPTLGKLADYPNVVAGTFSFSYVGSVFFEMQFVHDAVHKGRQHERRSPDEKQPGEKRVGRGE